MYDPIQSKRLSERHAKSPLFNRQKLADFVTSRLEPQIHGRSPLLRCDREALLERKEWFEGHEESSLSPQAKAHIAVQIQKIDSLLND
jgi:hypothetical protein